MSNPTDILAPPVVTLPPPKDDKWERERQAFWRLLPELLKTYPGEYVAIHEGRPVGHGPDILDVALRAHREHGQAPIFVDLVADEPQPRVRIPHYRLIGKERPA